MMTAQDQRADPFESTRPWRNIFYSKGWWHSFELPDGTRIDGVNSVASLRQRISQFPIPQDLRGKRVLDIGAWDGWFSFEMERRGASVMAIDNWDNPRFHEVHGMLHSRVEHRVMDVYDLTPSSVGRFDIVLFMGVLYHLKHPLLALERVCALTTGMAAVDSFILREEHVPGLDVETLPIMAYYETDEFAGQADNWVGPSLPCLLAFCRTAGFARVELQGVVESGACVACYREWEPPSPAASTGPELADVFHNKDGGINFESERDTYLSAFFFSPARDLSRDRVQAQVGGYGVAPIKVWQYGEEHWQVDFRLPPGLTPGWHDVRVRVDDSFPSNALRIAVDLPLEPGPIEVAGVRDGATWAPNQIDLKQGSALSIWITGLRENADRNNVRVFLNSVRLEAMHMTRAQPGEACQLNVMVPRDTPSGVAQIVAEVGSARSTPVPIAILGGAPPSTLATYDLIASEYAKRIFGELKNKPIDRNLLDRFVAGVQSLGPVCDLGCGPAQLAHYLSERGVHAFGLDCSANMLREARRLNPGIEFVRSDMHSLGIRTNTLAGIAAFYSLIHISRGRVPMVLAELRRVLRPGGHMLLAFHLGTGTLHETGFHGYAVDLDITRFTLDEMAGYLDAAGFLVEVATDREPYQDVEYPSKRGYVLAVKANQE